MAELNRARLVCVGAACIDTILKVPHFPAEDSKLRATAMRKRRGGNTPNTLEVLQQLNNRKHDQPRLELFLVATLPAHNCAETMFIERSFNAQYATGVRTDSVYNIVPTDEYNEIPSTSRRKVSLVHCIFRQDRTEAVSAYILDSEATSSRTIVNHNALLEMTYDEFVENTRELLKPAYLLYTASGLDDDAQPEVEIVWFHFEGRIPETTLACMQYLRNHDIFQHRLELRISVELEKPEREGLQALAQEADVVFYSKAWAEGEKYTSAEQCLRAQAGHFKSGSDPLYDYKALVCSWGEGGSSALIVPPVDPEEPPNESVIHKPAIVDPRKPVVDSTGAGDTFIAGMLFGFLGRHYATARARVLPLEDILDFANRLAGHKVRQEGFQGLWKLVSMKGLKKELAEL